MKYYTKNNFDDDGYLIGLIICSDNTDNDDESILQTRDGKAIYFENYVDAEVFCSLLNREIENQKMDRKNRE